MYPVRVVPLVLAILMVLIGAPARAELLITINKSTQRMTVDVDGVQRWVWPVSTGRLGYDTPNGHFTAFRMEADHFSKEWDDAPMPHSIFFTQKGHAIHGSLETRHIGSPASHGCVRLNPDNAAKLYSLVEEQGVTSAKVVVTGDVRVALGGSAATADAGQVRRYSRQPQYGYSVERPYGYYPYQQNYYSYRPYGNSY